MEVLAFKRLGQLSRKKFKQKSDSSTYIQYFEAVFRSLLMFYFCSFMSTKNFIMHLYDTILVSGCVFALKI